MELNLIAISVQAVGTLLVAALLWQLTRVIPGRFLRYWSAGWVALALALFALRIAAGDPLPAAVRSAWLAVYCLGGYLFGYLLWAGFRDFARGRPAGRWDLLVIAPLAAFGVAAPVSVPDANRLLPYHAPLLAVFFVLALVETFAPPRTPGRPVVGRVVVRVSLLVLAGLYGLFGPVLYWAAPGDAGEPRYLALTPVYDALAKLGLAFGMVLLATDRVREELEESNARLAAATEELARAARTDALTGLLNRRGYDELLAGKADRPFAGCLVVIDLNDLKRLNDTRGHQAGDAALQLVARALRVCVRVTDPIFRMGGDEFLVILPGGSAADLAARMGRIDQSLTGQRLPNAPDPLDLTVAWGVAEFAAGSDLAAAVARADRAMYVQKQARKSTSQAPGAQGHGEGKN
jgi:diguanylate cyclase (GGDEF)-like protein